MKRAQLATVVGVLCAVSLPAAALAGEGKNEAPFTRIVVATPQLTLPGEQKNMVPFTRTASPPRVAPDWFERYAAAHPYGRDAVALAPATAPAGFHWPDALIGAAAATAACLAFVALALGWTRRRNPPAGREPVGA